jgi:hypothetical protein
MNSRNGASSGGLPAAKLLALDVHMAGAPHLLRAGDAVGWDDVSPLRYRPPRTADELARELEAQAFAFGEPALPRVLRALAQYAGVAPEGAAANYFTLDAKLSPTRLHPWARLGLPGRQANVRAIPGGWQVNPLLRTPLVATESGTGQLALWFDDGAERVELGTAPVLKPNTTAPMAYRTADDIITANPRMICPQDCLFCIRHHLDASRNQLVNFSARETAEYLVARFGDVDWASMRLVKFVTGAFSTFDQLLAFLERFAVAISELTNGRFDPIHRPDQGVFVITNLGRTREEMQALKHAGVAMLEHTIEIVDDRTRRLLMTTAAHGGAAIAKGDGTFADMLAAAAVGAAEFQDKFGVALVVGMDDFDTTRRGLRELSQAGVRCVTAGIFVPNAYDELTLMQMRFSEVMDIRRAVARSFALLDAFAPSRPLA